MPELQARADQRDVTPAKVPRPLLKLSPGDGRRVGDVPAIDDRRVAPKAIQRHRVELGASRDHVRGRVDVGEGMAPDADPSRVGDLAPRHPGGRLQYRLETPVILDRQAEVDQAHP